MSNILKARHFYCVVCFTNGMADEFVLANQLGLQLNHIVKLIN